MTLVRVSFTWLLVAGLVTSRTSLDSDRRDATKSADGTPSGTRLARPLEKNSPNQAGAGYPAQTSSSSPFPPLPHPQQQPTMAPAGPVGPMPPMGPQMGFQGGIGPQMGLQGSMGPQMGLQGSMGPQMGHQGPMGPRMGFQGSVRPGMGGRGGLIGGALQPGFPGPMMPPLQGYPGGNPEGPSSNGSSPTVVMTPMGPMLVPQQGVRHLNHTHPGQLPSPQQVRHIQQIQQQMRMMMMAEMARRAQMNGVNPQMPPMGPMGPMGRMEAMGPSGLAGSAIQDVVKKGKGTKEENGQTADKPNPKSFIDLVKSSMRRGDKSVVSVGDRSSMPNPMSMMTREMSHMGMPSSQEIGLPPQMSPIAMGMPPQFAQTEMSQRMSGLGMASQMPRTGMPPQMDQMGMPPQTPQMGLPFQMPRMGMPTQMLRNGLPAQMSRMSMSLQMPQTGMTPQLPEMGMPPQMSRMGMYQQLPSMSIPPVMQRRGMRPPMAAMKMSSGPMAMPANEESDREQTSFGVNGVQGPVQLPLKDLKSLMSFEYNLQHVRLTLLKSFYQDLVAYRLMTQQIQKRMMTKLAMIHAVEARMAMPMRGTVAMGITPPNYSS